jgi:hypothetical protein
VVTELKLEYRNLGPGQALCKEALHKPTSAAETMLGSMWTQAVSVASSHL